MLGKKKLPDFLQLNHFAPFASLQDDQLILLANQAQIKSYKKGARILKLGDRSKSDFFLLEGSVACKEASGTSFTIRAPSPSSQKPLAKLRPSLYEVCATEPSTLLLIDASLTDSAIKEAPQKAISLEDRIKQETSSGRKLFYRIYEDLRNNKLILPSIPSVAFKVRELIDSGKSGTKEISAAISIDPAMATKIVKAANSPLYRGAATIESSNQAIVRLGLGVTRQLVLSFALRDVFKIKNKQLKSLMDQLWEHSVEVAAISYALSKKLKLLNPEEALLAGLLHDIGAIPVIQYAEQFPDLLSAEGELECTIDGLKGELGGVMLERWNFPKELVVAAKDAEHWIRNVPEKDYCDLIIIAQMHTYADSHRMEQMPKLHELPSFSRTGLNKLTPEKFIELLDEAKAQRDEIKGLISS